MPHPRRLLYGLLLGAQAGAEFPQGRCHEAALRQKAGRINAAGMTKEVAFDPVTGNERIDDACGAKYSKSPYLDPMRAARARSVTVKIIPRTKKRKCPEKQGKAKIERIADQF